MGYVPHARLSSGCSRLPPGGTRHAHIPLPPPSTISGRPSDLWGHKCSQMDEGCSTNWKNLTERKVHPVPTSLLPDPQRHTSSNVSEWFVTPVTMSTARLHDVPRQGCFIMIIYIDIIQRPPVWLVAFVYQDNEGLVNDWRVWSIERLGFKHVFFCLDVDVYKLDNFSMEDVTLYWREDLSLEAPAPHRWVNHQLVGLLWLATQIPTLSPDWLTKDELIL